MKTFRLLALRLSRTISPAFPPMSGPANAAIGPPGRRSRHRPWEKSKESAVFQMSSPSATTS